MFTERRVVDTGLKLQPNIGSSQNVISPKNLITAHQTAARMEVPNKVKIIAMFDNIDVGKYFVEIDGVRYPEEGVNVNYAANDNNDQQRDPKLNGKGYVGEDILISFLYYTSKINFFRIQVIVLRFQIDHISPRKFQHFEEYRRAANKARWLVILIKREEIKINSNGVKIAEIRDIN